MKEEIFKTVKGYEGLYEVSDLGRVKSLARKSLIGRNLQEKIMKIPLNPRGYPSISLSKDGKVKLRTIHQLVAEAFLGHEPNGMKLIVNHIDFDKTNNNANNLEIVTQRKNTNKKHLKSSSEYTGVHLHKASNKWGARIHINGKYKHLGLFKCELKAAEAYNLALKQLNRS